MSAATIICIDVVQFSKRPTSKQRDLINALTTKVGAELRLYLTPAFGVPSVIAMPTGDGVVLAFVHSHNSQWDAETIFGFIGRLQKWAFEDKPGGKPIRLRMGIHVGAIELVSDINGRLNVCGETINRAQRIMDAANPMQVLFSDSAYHEYVGSSEFDDDKLRLDDGLLGHASGPFEVHAKHGLRILVYKIELDNNVEWWNNDDPDACRLDIVALTSLPKQIAGSFAERLQEANNVALIQLKGDKLLSEIENQGASFSDQLQRLWVFMPDADVHNRYAAITGMQPTNTDHLSRWQSFLIGLASRHSTAEIRLGRLTEVPFFGASFLDWESRGGRIHVSPYIWGVRAEECPGYDFEWIGHPPSPIYETYVRGLRFLYENAPIIDLKVGTTNVEEIGALPCSTPATPENIEL